MLYTNHLVSPQPIIYINHIWIWVSKIEKETCRRWKTLFLKYKFWWRSKLKWHKSQCHVSLKYATGWHRNVQKIVWNVPRHLMKKCIHQTKQKFLGYEEIGVARENHWYVTCAPNELNSSLFVDVLRFHYSKSVLNEGHSQITLQNKNGFAQGKYAHFIALNIFQFYSIVNDILSSFTA